MAVKAGLLFPKQVLCVAGQVSRAVVVAGFLCALCQETAGEAKFLAASFVRG